MSRRLIIALVAIAGVALLVGPVFAAVQNVKVSGDVEVMPLIRNSFDLQKATDTNSESGILSFLRLRVDADLTDNVSVTTRFLNERVWGLEDNAATPAITNQSNTDISLDLAYVTLKEFLYSPLTLTIGRQELHMGSEMIVGDPDTNNAVSTASALSGVAADLSKRKSFDAFRATLDYSPLVVDAIYAKIRETSSNSTANILTNDDDTDLWGIDATYDLGDKYSSMLEAYFYQKLTQKKAFASATISNKTDTVDVLGGRITMKPAENVSASFEGAYQFGKRNPNTATLLKPQDRSAYALEGGVTLAMPKVRYTPTLTLLAAYFSGEPNNNNQGTYKQWDPMYENQTYGNIANALLNQTNIKLVGLVGTAKLTDDIMAKVAFNSYWWAKRYNTRITNTITSVRGATLYINGKSFVGSEIDAMLTYDYTEDVQFGLTAGAFIPSSLFVSNVGTRAKHTASQLLASMLVKF